MVHQHFMLVDNFTIAENIMLGNEITRSLGMLDHQQAEAKIRDLGKRYGLEVDPRAKIQDVSVGVQRPRRDPQGAVSGSGDPDPR